MRYTTKVTLSSQATLGIFGRVWTSDVIGDHHVSFTMHLALRFTPQLWCDVIPQLWRDVIQKLHFYHSYSLEPVVYLLHCRFSPQLWRYVRQLHNCAVVRSLLKSYAIFVIPALPRLDQIPIVLVNRSFVCNCTIVQSYDLS